MKISELQAQLEAIKQEHGDLPVKMYRNYIDGIYDGYSNVNANYFSDRWSGKMVELTWEDKDPCL